MHKSTYFHRVELRSSTLAPGAWIWVDQPPSLGSSTYTREVVHSAAELRQVLTTYGTIIGRLMRPSVAAAFRLTAHSESAGQMVGMSGWTYHLGMRRYLSDGEPWTAWPRWLGDEDTGATEIYGMPPSLA